MCLLLEKPRQLTSEELYAGERFQSGWWVAKAQFYKLVQESERGYQLAREFLLNLNCMVRPGVPWIHGYLRILALALYCGYGYKCNTAVLHIQLYCTYRHFCCIADTDTTAIQLYYVQYTHFCCIAVPDTDAVPGICTLRRSYVCLCV